MNSSALSRVPPSAPAPAPVEYPSSDGKPMAENDFQLAAMLYAISALQTWFSPRTDVYASGDLLVYYEEGNPKACVAPDAFVVFGVEDRKRMTYKVWEEGKAPDFVMEVASPGTWRDDAGRKRALYARLGVTEYWQYDPQGTLLVPVLQGRRLRGGRYERIGGVESVDGRLTLHSVELGLDVWAKGETLRFRDPATGEELSSYDEERAARRTAEERAEHAEARIAELEALLGAKRD